MKYSVETNALAIGYGKAALARDIALGAAKGQVLALIGPNGAGKSTLGYVLMGAPKYTVTGGQILFKGEDITHESTDKRAKAGMFLSFQEPLEVPIGTPISQAAAWRCRDTPSSCGTTAKI